MLQVTLRNLFAHKARLLLTGVSIILGVGFVSGTFVFTDTLKATVNELIGRVSKNLSVVVRAQSDFSTSSVGAADRGLVPDSLVNTVKAIPGVKIAVPDVQGSDLLVTSAGKAVTPKSPGPPTLAVSWTPENFGTLTFVQGHGPTGAGQVALDQASAQAYHLKVGDQVTVQTQATPIKSTLVGIATIGGSSNFAGAVLSIFDPATAAQIVGKPGFANQIDIKAAPGVSETELASRITPTLPKGYEAVTAAQVNKEQSTAFSKAFKFFNIFLLVFAAVALVVGLFIILNTFTMLVAQRTRELALLRAIGASRRQVMTAVLAESFVVGLISSTVGLGFGIGIAISVRGLLSALGVALPAGPLIVRLHTVVVAYVVGVLVTLIGAAFPSRRASRIPPVAAMRDNVALADRSLRLRAVVGTIPVALGAVITVASFGGKSGAASARVGIGALLVVVGLVVVSPPLSRPVVRFLGLPFDRLFGITGRLATSNAIRNPRRTAATSTAVMIGLAVVSLVAVLASSTKASIASVVNNNLGADYVLTSSSFAGFSPDVAAKAAATPGVSSVGETRIGQAKVNDKTVFIVAVSSNIGSAIKIDMAGGSLASLSSNELLVSKSTADADKLKVGDTESVEYAEGTHDQLRIGGIFDDNALLGSGGANYLISLPTYEKNYTSQLDSIVYVVAATGQRDAVGTALKTSLVAYPQVKIDGQTAYKDSITKQIDGFVNLVFALLFLTLLIAALGIVNTLALSVYERTREIGLLRAVGTTRRQVRRMIRLESAVITVYGALLGIGVGVVFGWSIVSTADGQLDHTVFPILELILFVVGAAIVGVLAALWPAWRAARRPVLAAISTE